MSAKATQNRRMYGVHLTSTEIFRQYILPEIRDSVFQFSWVDLFAGEGNLVLPILQEVPQDKRVQFFEDHIFLFDILDEMVDRARENAERYGIPHEIAKKNIVRRDTISDYPTFVSRLKFPAYHITNPPYLYLGYIRKHRETDKYLPYFEGDNEGYQDLYQLALLNDLRNGIKSMIYIIPSNFLFGFSVSNKARMDFLKYYRITKATIFEKKIFEFTGTNVVICFFERKAASANGPQDFEATKIDKGIERRRYHLVPDSMYRAGSEFDDFVDNHVASEPLKVNYYLMQSEVDRNQGDNKVLVIDASRFVHGEYEREEIRVNDTLYRKIKSNPLFIRTVDTGSREGRAGIYSINEEFHAEGILVSRAPYRTHPIQIFFEPVLDKERLDFVRKAFNLALEFFRKETDSEFMTTYKYSDSDYTRKYLGLSQARRLLYTIPVRSFTGKQVVDLTRLADEGDVDSLLKATSTRIALTHFV